MYDRDRRLVVSNRCYAEMYKLRPEDVKPGMTFDDVIRQRVEAGNRPLEGSRTFIDKWVALVGENEACEEALMRTETRKQASLQIRTLLAGMVIGPFLLVSSYGQAETSRIERKCAVFSSAGDRARCACALQHGGWLTRVHGEWQWIYEQRHRERHCHGQTSARTAE